MIHKEGKFFLIYSFLIIFFLLFIIFFLFTKTIFLLSCVISFTFYMFIIYFFRNPKRFFFHKNKKIIISPADGKIIEIKRIFENEFLKEKCFCISIFISILDVHVNRYPISGKIIYIKYNSGKYFIAWLKKTSLQNEHTTLVIKTIQGKKILLRQIAGFIARRIVTYAKKNSIVKSGDELGFIKFGSRVDIFVPLNSKILIKKGEKVIGGITKISFIP
ncbi:phosphatidylserine decarboxylase family protein [Blattabacterium cuenoti]|uniref:phosphatidylserine decarboxylase family protein n=1 Tax=Blattabacterium cuenoti TaxID=1653831 RepID=UPI00163C6296|nr:phosphatidylserine decarboxylase family protein [Blattabacterium cuenoti]